MNLNHHFKVFKIYIKQLVNYFLNPSTLNPSDMIRIKMRNFKCYADKEVNFKTAFTLLKGATGSGKSTILEAIYYALYGDVKKPFTFGTTTCQVDLDIFGMNITRTGRPNRLVVKYEAYEYEDSEAQAIINKKFMNMHEFLASSYIKQKSNNSLLSMTSMEQVTFIKNIAFDTDTNLKIKERIKEMIKETNIELTKERSSVKFIEEQLSELHKDSFEITVNPLKISEEKFEKDMNEMRKKIDVLKISKRHIQDEFDDKNAIYTKNIELSSKRELLTGDVNELYDKIESIGKVSSDENLDKIENALEKLKADRAVFFEYDFFLEQEMLFEEACDTFFDNQTAKLKELKKDLLTEEDVEEYKKLQEEFTVYDVSKKKVENVLNILRSSFIEKEPTETLEFEEALEFLREKATVKVLKCPTCKTSLVMENGSLTEAYTKSKKGDEQFDKYLDILLKNSEIYLDPKQNYSDILRKNDILLRSIEDVRDILKNRRIPDHLEKERKRVEGLKMDEPETDFLELDAKIKKYEKYLTDQWNLKSQKNNLEAILSKKKKQLDEILEVSKEIVDKKIIREFEKKLRDVDEELTKSLEKYEEYNKLKYNYSQYKMYEEHQKNVKEISERLKKAKETENKHEISYNALLTLRETSNKAEILALDSIIENINEYAKDFLNSLFPEDPIVVRVENYKETKGDIKCKMNTIIQYKGSQYDTVDQLSGGERQKVEIAFELAVNNLLNSKVLMLDECINNLDKEMNEEILHILAEYAREFKKLVIVVSHEATQGVFDNEVEVK